MYIHILTINTFEFRASVMCLLLDTVSVLFYFPHVMPVCLIRRIWTDENIAIFKGP